MSLFEDDHESPEGDMAYSDEEDAESDDPFHFSVGSLPEISFARGSTFPGLQADSRSRDFEDIDSDSGSSDTERSSVATRHAAHKAPAEAPPEEILYIQMVSCPHPSIFAANISEGVRGKTNPKRSKYPRICSRFSHVQLTSCKGD